MKRYRWAVALALGLIAAAALLWWQRQVAAPSPGVDDRPTATAEAPAPLAAPSSPALPASAAAIAHPIPPLAAAQTPATAADIEAALTELFGRKTVLSMFQLDDFARRLVATVDNLGRASASARLWPVNPSAGKFAVEQREDGVVIGADNALRYTPFVLLVETVDMGRVVDAYARLYPLFQQAYEELGYPKRYFNDRLVQVIDQLLATPEIDGPLKVELPQFNGPVQPERPWVLYGFADPALRSLSAGQKILLRTGPVNERRLKAKLAEIRRLVTTRSVGR